MTETLTVPELPAAEVVGTGMERADWLARRRLGIGGSDVAALLGISPWHSQMSLWMEKLLSARTASRSAGPQRRAC